MLIACDCQEDNHWLLGVVNSNCCSVFTYKILQSGLWTHFQLESSCTNTLIVGFEGLQNFYLDFSDLHNFLRKICFSLYCIMSFQILFSQKLFLLTFLEENSFPKIKMLSIKPSVHGTANGCIMASSHWKPNRLRVSCFRAWLKAFGLSFIFTSPILMWREKRVTDSFTGMSIVRTPGGGKLDNSGWGSR